MKIVNIEKAKEEFITFTNNYDLTNDHINRKKYHSLRVTEISEELAKRENFTEEEIEIATLIGLLHDIARFNQYTEYQTFRDADKVDIMFEAVYAFWNNEIEEMENSKITPELKKEFDQRKMLVTKNYKKIVYADKLIQFLGFMYDLNYKSSFQIINEKNYIDQIINRFNFKDEYTQEQIIDAGEKIKQYILSKIQE